MTTRATGQGKEATLLPRTQRLCWRYINLLAKERGPQQGWQAFHRREERQKQQPGHNPAAWSESAGEGRKFLKETARQAGRQARMAKSAYQTRPVLWGTQNMYVSLEGARGRQRRISEGLILKRRTQCSVWWSPETSASGEAVGSSPPTAVHSSHPKALCQSSPAAGHFYLHVNFEYWSSHLTMVIYLLLATSNSPAKYWHIAQWNGWAKGSLNPPGKTWVPFFIWASEDQFSDAPLRVTNPQANQH